MINKSIKGLYRDYKKTYHTLYMAREYKETSETDIQKMRLEYMQPTMTLKALAKKYRLSENTIYNIAKMHKWNEDKRTVAELCYQEALAEYISKRKNSLLSDLEKFSVLGEKIMNQLIKAGQLDGFTAKDWIELQKAKYDIIGKILINKFYEGATPPTVGAGNQFNISELNLTYQEIDSTVKLLVDDLKQDLGTTEPVSTLRALKKRKEVIDATGGSKKK